MEDKASFSTIEELKEYLVENGYEDSVVFESPDYVSAVIGVSSDGRVVYDFDLMVRDLMVKDGMEEIDAIEFIEYNTVRAIPYAGELSPIVVYGIHD